MGARNGYTHRLRNLVRWLLASRLGRVLSGSVAVIGAFMAISGLINVATGDWWFETLFFWTEDSNARPEIVRLFARERGEEIEPEVNPGGAIFLNVIAVDPEGDRILYEWAAAEGIFRKNEVSDPLSPLVLYQPPVQPGVYPVRIRVRDEVHDEFDEDMIEVIVLGAVRETPSPEGTEVELPETPPGPEPGTTEAEARETPPGPAPEGTQPEGTEAEAGEAPPGPAPEGTQPEATEIPPGPLELIQPPDGLVVDTLPGESVLFDWTATTPPYKFSLRALGSSLLLKCVSLMSSRHEIVLQPGVYLWSVHDNAGQSFSATLQYTWEKFETPPPPTPTETPRPRPRPADVTPRS